MANLRKLARGRECQVRLPCCNGNPETVVLGHVRMIGVSGMGLKAPDQLGAWTCSACHQAADSLQYNGERYEREFVELAFLRGVIRTQYALIREGVL